MTLSYISIAEMAVALGLVTSRCGSNKHAGAHKNGGWDENPSSSETKLHFLSLWQSIQSTD